MNAWACSFSLVGQNLGLMSPYEPRKEHPNNVLREWWSGLTRRA